MGSPVNSTIYLRDKLFINLDNLLQRTEAEGICFNTHSMRPAYYPNTRPDKDIKKRKQQMNISYEYSYKIPLIKYQQITSSNIYKELYQHQVKFILVMYSWSNTGKSIDVTHHFNKVKKEKLLEYINRCKKSI